MIGWVATRLQPITQAVCRSWDGGQGLREEAITADRSKKSPERSGLCTEATHTSVPRVEIARLGPSSEITSFETTVGNYITGNRIALTGNGMDCRYSTHANS